MFRSKKACDKYLYHAVTCFSNTELARVLQFFESDCYTVHLQVGRKLAKDHDCNAKDGQCKLLALISFSVKIYKAVCTMASSLPRYSTCRCTTKCEQSGFDQHSCQETDLVAQGLQGQLLSAHSAQSSKAKQDDTLVCPIALVLRTR